MLAFAWKEAGGLKVLLNPAPKQRPVSVEGFL